MSTETATANGGHTFFGHPRGLATLFFTEMWERFAYYGMRALLVLYMTATTTHWVVSAEGTPLRPNPGLGFDVATATAIYGLYVGLVYILSLPGGWVADNLWGQRKAIFVGGCFIAAGQLSMALPFKPTFFLGLFFIIIGTGLLKPNVSTVVGELYPEGGARRDAGFSVFYMGINIGALLGPALTGIFGEQHNWHYGFGIGALGMILGLTQYKLGDKYLGDRGFLKTTDTPEQLRAKTLKFYGWFVGIVAALAAFGVAVWQGVIPITLTNIAESMVSIVLVLVLLYFLYLWIFGHHTKDEKKRLVVILWLFLLISLFWAGFEQAGTSFNLFARDLTNRNVFGWLMPTAWLQDVNPIFIIIFAPIFGSLWIFLDKIKANPPLPLKAALGLLFVSAGFFVIAWGAVNATKEHPVTMAWLVVTYFLHTVGELCISPIGLSAITKLSPAKRVGQMMGIWFVGAALGNVIASLVAGRLENLAPAPVFHQIAMVIGIVGIFAVLVSPGVKKLMAGVE